MSEFKWTPDACGNAIRQKLEVIHVNDANGDIIEIGDEAEILSHDGSMVIVEGTVSEMNRTIGQLGIEDDKGIVYWAPAEYVRRVRAWSPPVPHMPRAMGYGVLGSEAPGDWTSYVAPAAKTLCREHTPAASFGKRGWCTKCDVSLEFVDMEWRVK